MHVFFFDQPEIEVTVVIVVEIVHVRHEIVNRIRNGVLHRRLRAKIAIHIHTRTEVAANDAHHVVHHDTNKHIAMSMMMMMINKDICVEKNHINVDVAFLF